MTTPRLGYRPQPTCGCRLGRRCDDHLRCDERGTDHDMVETNSFYRYLTNTVREDIVVYSCTNCDKHESTKVTTGGTK